MYSRPDGDSSDEEEASPYTAVVSGPAWSVPLKPSELSDFIGMLSQLRLMVANLAAQGQWHAASSDRPASRVKVRQGLGRVVGLVACMKHMDHSPHIGCHAKLGAVQEKGVALGLFEHWL